MTKIVVLLSVIAIITTGCVGLPKTVAEKESGYTYVPIDPFPVEVVPGFRGHDT